MTIKIYPSALDGKPIETHEIESPISVIDWFKSNIRGFDLSSPISNSLSVSVNGKRLSIDKWMLVIEPEDDVKIIIEPKGTEAIAIANLVISIVAAVAAYVFAPSAPKNRSMQGKELGMPDLSANEVRYGDAVPEIAGSPIHYPDYLSPPRRWFVDKRTQKIEMLLCVGMGSFDYSLDNVWIGDTPAQSIYNIVDVNIYPPGASLSLDPAAQHWHSCPEVGVTSVAGAGIALKYNAPKAIDWPATAFTFGQDSPQILGGHPLAQMPYPTSWAVGDSLRIPYQDRVIFGDDYVQSRLLDSIGVSVGDSIEVGGTNDGVYQVISVTPAVPGDAGTPSTITGSISPDVDWSSMPTTLLFIVGGSQRAVVIDQDYVDIDGLISGINSQLTGFNMVASKTGAPSVLRFTELTPFSGSEIGYNGENGWLMGTPIKVTGTATTATTLAKYHTVENFIPATEVVEVGLEGFEYTIASLTPTTRINVVPFGKTTWGGFTETRITTESSVSQSGRTLPGSVYGPFRATPLGAKCDAFECDIFMPRGLYYTRKNGDVKARTANRKVLWRKVGETLWNEVNSSTTDWTRDQIGLTIRVDLPEPMEVEVSIEAGKTWVDPRIVDEQQWIGLRSRIVGYPTSYPDFTVMAVTMSSGDAIATQAESKVKVRFTRILPRVDDAGVSESTRELAPFFIHAIEATGKYGRNNIDMQALQDAHDYWVANGHKFDLAITSQSTLKQVLNQITKAGFGETVASRGKITPVLDIKRDGIPMRIYSPHQYVSPLVESITMPRDDDIDGVDCEYVDFETGKTETVSFRLPSDQGLRTTTIKAIGVTDRVSAWRIAARHRLMLEYRRVSYSGQTEMHMLTNQYMDYVGLQDGWYEYGQSAYVMASSGNRVRVSEPIRDWSTDMVMLFRDSEGKVSEPVSVLSVENEYVAIVENVPVQISLGENGEEATVVYFGSIERMYYPALITAINPQENGITSFGAVKYDERIYAYDTPLQIVGELGNGANNESYSFTLSAAGNLDGIVWAADFGGISGIDIVDGVVSGVPSAPVGYHIVVVTIENAIGQTASREFTVGIGEIISLLHFNGANNSATFTDETGKSWIRDGSCVISTAQSKFGGSSFRTSANGQRLRLPAASATEFNFGSEPFTIDCWAYTSSYSGSNYPFLFAKNNANNTTSSGSAFAVGAFGTSGAPYPRPFGFDINKATSNTQGGGIHPLSQWFHIEFSQDGEKGRLFINGVLLIDVAATTITAGTIADMLIGAGYTNANTGWWPGWIDEFRATKGVARHTKNFTPPEAPSDYPVV